MVDFLYAYRHSPAMAIPARYLLDLPAQQYAIQIVFGTLPSVVLNFMFSKYLQQQSRLVASIVMLGNMSSIAVIPIVLAIVP